MAEIITVKNKPKVSDSFVNIRAVLMTYQLGIGSNDLSRMLSMININGGLSFERNFHRHVTFVNEQIHSVCNEIIEVGFKDEIFAALTAKVEIKKGK